MNQFQAEIVQSEIIVSKYYRILLKSNYYWVSQGYPGGFIVSNLY
jgi:hypothetical protein